MKYLVQDGGKVKKATMDGLEVVKEGVPIGIDFDTHGSENLSDIIGQICRDFNMVYQKGLGESKIYRYKLTGFTSINQLVVK